MGCAIFPTTSGSANCKASRSRAAGASANAGEILAQLRAGKHADEETLGMLARTYKDGAARTQNSTKRRALWRQAAVAYDEAYRLSRGIWTGINAATTALLTGRKVRARTLAQEVQAACRKQLRARRTDKFWLFATLGEAALILRDWAQAEDWYGRAAQIAGRRFGDLQSSRRNARLLLNYWKANPAAIEAHLRIPQAIVFAGHMIDQPGRASARFPKELEGAVAAAIRERIAKLDAGFGFSSAPAEPTSSSSKPCWPPGARSRLSSPMNTSGSFVTAWK